MNLASLLYSLEHCNGRYSGYFIYEALGFSYASCYCEATDCFLKSLRLYSVGSDVVCSLYRAMRRPQFVEQAAAVPTFFFMPLR